MLHFSFFLDTKFIYQMQHRNSTSSRYGFMDSPPHPSSEWAGSTDKITSRAWVTSKGLAYLKAHVSYCKGLLQTISTTHNQRGWPNSPVCRISKVSSSWATQRPGQLESLHPQQTCSRRDAAGPRTVLAAASPELECLATLLDKADYSA